MEKWRKAKDFELRMFIGSVLAKKVKQARQDYDCYENEWEGGKWEEVLNNYKFEITINGEDTNGDSEQKTSVFNGPPKKAIFGAMDAWNRTRFLCRPPESPSDYTVLVVLPNTKILIPTIFYAWYIKEWFEQNKMDYFKHELPGWLKESHVIVVINQDGKIVDAAILDTGSLLNHEEKEKEFRLKYPEPQFKIHKGLYLDI